MIEKGLIDEVKKVVDAGFDKKSNSLNTVGYKEIILYLDGHISLDEVIDLIKGIQGDTQKGKLLGSKKMTGSSGYQ